MQLSTIRLVLVDDHEMVLDALAARLQQHPNLRVVGTARNSDEAVSVVLEQRPDVVLMDVNLPGRGAFDAADDILGALPQTKILILSGFLADVFVAQALRLRSAGYLLKGESFDELCTAILRAAAGEMVFSPAVRERILYDPENQRYLARFESDLAALTGRQLEVLRHLASGQSVKEIARLMHLSQKSVDSHKYRIMNKLGIHDRVELARFAIREGLLTP